MSDQEIKFALEEDEKARAWAGEQGRKFADAAVEFQVELSLRGITQKAQRDLLTKALASRHALQDYMHGSAKRFDAKAAVDQTLSSAFGEFAGQAAKTETPSASGPLSYEEIAKLTPQARINYARKYKIGLS